jgi:glycosyltransferase involved in cell wall biosynthesis
VNILLIHQYFLEKDEGGGSRFNEMTSMWASKGHHITIIAGMVHYNTGIKKEKYRKKLFLREQFANQIEIIRCHVSEAYNKSFLGRFWGYLSFTLYSTWAGIFKTREKYDLILATSPPLFTGLSAMIISFLKRIPFVFEVRDLWPESAIDAGVLKNKMIIRMSYWLESRIYRRARKINVLTPAFREILIRRKKIFSEKIMYIPNGVDFSLLEAISGTFNTSQFRKDHNLPDDVFLMIYVGAHGVANGLGLILETAKKLRNDPVFFMLIGTGMEKAKLQEQVVNEDIDNILFLDPVPRSEVYKYILVSDAGISILIKADTFKTIYSNKTFDYMSCKKPILMAIDGISRELVETAESGLYVEPGNAEDFTEKIRFYLRNRTLAKKHGENGYTFVKKHFNRKDLALEYLEELEKIAGRKKGK